MIKSGLNRGFWENRGSVQDKLDKLNYIYTVISKYFMNQQYFTFDAVFKNNRLTINRGSVGNWDYEIYTDFKKQTVLGWCSSDMSGCILFDEKAKTSLELPWLWVKALEEVDNAMCRHWRSRHS